MKAETPYFSDLKCGGPRGDLWRLYFSICERCQSKKIRKIKSFKVKYRFPKSPRGPPTSDLKSMESQLSLEKKIIKRSFVVQFLSSVEVSSIWSGIQLMRLFDFELEIISQIPDQTSEFHITVKNYRKKIST